jgi:subtilisin family serine protease
MKISKVLFFLALVVLPGVLIAQSDLRVVVVFNSASDDSLIKQHGGKILLRVSSLNMVVANIAPCKLIHVASDPGVLRVYEDVPVSILQMGKSGKPPKESSPPQSLPWGVDRIDAELSWSTAVGTGVKLGIIDTGIDPEHPDFMDASGESRVVLGPTYVNGTKTSKDDNGHGTHVAGTAGASNNSIGVVGVAPECTLYAIKVLNRKGFGWLSDVVAGINWATQNGMQVINLSLGTTSDYQELKDAVDSAVAEGVVVCAAAGNNGDGSNSPVYPAAYPSVIAIGATDPFDQRADFSTYGPQLDLAAPGVDIYSTWKGGEYKTASGTSMATPHVAGTAALVLSRGVEDANGDGRINDEVRTILQTTADDVNGSTSPGWDEELGYGLVDAEESTTGIQTQ